MPSTPTLTTAFVAKLVAKADTADEVRTLLAGALSLANDEAGTIVWFALRTDPTTFWIVDAFPSDTERQAHLNGQLAGRLFEKTIQQLQHPFLLFQGMEKIAQLLPGQM